MCETDIMSIIKWILTDRKQHIETAEIAKRLWTKSHGAIRNLRAGFCPNTLPYNIIIMYIKKHLLVGIFDRTKSISKHIDNKNRIVWTLNFLWKDVHLQILLRIDQNLKCCQLYFPWHRHVYVPRLFSEKSISMYHWSIYCFQKWHVLYEQGFI